MGILLTFMFLWNMLGALIGVPALSYFLLRDTRPALAETGEKVATPRASVDASAPQGRMTAPLPADAR